METLLPGLPVPVALAAVAVFGYLFGRFQRTTFGPRSDTTQRELKRARAIVNDLELIADRIRRELAQHHSSLAIFKNRVSELSQTAAASDWQLLCNEAERMLKPTQDPAMQL